MSSSNRQPDGTHIGSSIASIALGGRVSSVDVYDAPDGLRARLAEFARRERAEGVPLAA